jgi:hypothetical protein
MQESASLVEACVALGVESQHARAKRKQPTIVPARIRCLLIADDYAPWRQKVCSQAPGLRRIAVRQRDGGWNRSCPEISRIEARLDTFRPPSPSPERNRSCTTNPRSCPRRSNTFASMDKDTDTVRKALNTGAMGYVLKTDAGSELWPAVLAVLQKKQYLSRGVQCR